MSQVFPKMTSLSVLELTWYIHPLRIPVDPDVVLDTIGKTFPPAMPMRFGLGDPPAFKWGPDGADRFRAEWRDKMEAGYFTQWTGK